MRFPVIMFLLATLLVTSLSVSFPKATYSGPDTNNGASSPTNAWDSLVLAYSSVRSAESDGASRDAVGTLSSKLDIGLYYYENSTFYASQNNTIMAGRYATLSISQSSNITTEANALDMAARTHALQRLELTYITAFVIAAVTSTTIIEADRIENFLQEKKAGNSKTRPGSR